MKGWRLTRQVSSKLTPSYKCETALTYVPQNVIAVIEAHPIKKIKTEWVALTESSNNVRQVAAGDVPGASKVESTATASRQSHKGAAVPKNPQAKLKATKDNLPLIMQNNPNKKWSKVVLPCILLWYEDQANVWSIKKADLEDVIINVVCYVYPSLVGDKSNLVQMQHGGCIYDLVCTALPPL